MQPTVYRPSPAQPGGNGRLVLAIDDDEDLLGVIQMALSEKGFRVETATNGVLALQKAEELFPQLVLLDMHMPVMDGWEFTRRFREKYGRRVPIVIMTAAEDSMLRADEVGADFYLGKPFELSDLLAVVEDTAGSV